MGVKITTVGKAKTTYTAIAVPRGRLFNDSQGRLLLRVGGGAVLLGDEVTLVPIPVVNSSPSIFGACTLVKGDVEIKVGLK